MGIRNIIQSIRERSGGTDEDALVITPASRELARKHMEGRTEEGPLAFRVATVPAEIGFRVRVALELVEEGTVLRSEYGDFPVAVSTEDWDRLRGYTIDVREDRFVTLANVSVHVEDTPNPDSRKFTVNRRIMTGGSATFERAAADAAPPLARMLLEIPGVKRVFFIDTFCTVTRVAGTEWDALVEEVGRRLQAYFAHGGPRLDPPKTDPGSLGEVEARIIEILETSVRPAVQRDGGDIAFAGYEDGVVQLYMLGSCVGCPSSTATLKMGIENLLRDAVPEVREVVSIS